MSLLTPPRITGSSVRPGDRNFRFTTTAAGIAVLGVLAAIAAFLVWQSIPALQNNTGNVFTNQQWLPDADPPEWGIAVLIFGTLWTSLIAMVLAVPIGIGTALFITFYAPRRIARTLGFVVDLLAAVPSIIFGLWGLYYFMPQIVPAAQWLSSYLGWIPFFSNNLDLYTKSILIAGFVLAIMILPTVSAISREVFWQVPKGHIEASLALGATRWEMIRMAVLPFSRPNDLRRDARSRPRLGRDDRRRIDPLSRLRDQLADHRTRRQLHRSEHRTQMGRGSREWTQRLDRHRYGAVLHHPRGEHDRPLGGQPPT